MSSKNIMDRFNLLMNSNKFICDSSELQDFILSGLLIQSGNKFMTRDMKEIDVKVLKDIYNEFDIDFNYLISICNNLVKDSDNKKVYVMSKDTYNKYKNLGRIFIYKDKEYYRFFNNENWLVYII